MATHNSVAATAFHSNSRCHLVSQPTAVATALDLFNAIVAASVTPNVDTITSSTVFMQPCRYPLPQPSLLSPAPASSSAALLLHSLVVAAFLLNHNRNRTLLYHRCPSLIVASSSVISSPYLFPAFPPHLPPVSPSQTLFCRTHHCCLALPLLSALTFRLSPTSTSVASNSSICHL
ncbi:hypothetical protein BHM03_00051183 [Ensete ventricosum]|nr:hypothetical protein BHM03_00051183 [Ensete ventricosum]